MAAANRAAAERALHDVQFTATVRQERHDYYVGEAERWEHLAARAPPTTGHAGMSNDNKALADVQPGRRVRLGDQAERARFEEPARKGRLPGASSVAMPSK